MHVFDFEFEEEPQALASGSPPGNANTLTFTGPAPTSVCIVNDGKAEITFTPDQKRFDKLVQWLFDNTKGRFVFLGTNRIYFENEDDAIAFKLGWL